MNRRLLLAAAFAWASSARAAEGPLPEVDRLLARLERSCAGAEAAPSRDDWARAEKSCRDSFTFDGMLASYGKAWTEGELSHDWNGFVFAVVMNQVCVGAAIERPDSCSDLSPLWDVRDGEKGRPGMGPVDPERTLRELCREEQNEPRAMRAYARGAEGFLEACRNGVLAKVPVDKRAAVCPAAAAHFDDPKLAAAAAVAAWELHDQSEVEHIAHDIAVARGMIEPSDCKTEDPFKTDMCFASYAAARKREGKTAGCGDSAFCRMLTGGGRAACEPYELEARAIFCSRDFKELAVRAKRRAAALSGLPRLRATAERARRLLDSVKPADGPAVSARRARLAALNDRLAAIAAEAGRPSAADRR